VFGRGWLTGGNALPSDGVFWMKDAPTPPTDSVSGAGGFYSDGGVPMWRVDGGAANQNILLRDGDVTVGHLAKFGSDAALEDFVYEEGSWTPVLKGSGTAGTQTYSVQAGRYIRIGNIVMISGRVALTAKDGTTAGTLEIDGLPFVPSNISGLAPAFAVGNLGGLTLDAGYTQVGGVGLVNTTTVLLQEYGSTKSASSLTEAALSATTSIEINGVYRIN
jgi:hypothetical protein